MRDDSQKWDASLGLNRADIVGSNVSISLQAPMRQTLVSGSANKALSLAKCSQRVTWPELASGDCYALSLRRDRTLVVNGPELVDGWNTEHSLAISDVSDAYSVIQISREGALALLNRGTELDPNLPSGSVTRLFHGYTSLIYRWEHDNSFRVHVDRASLDGLWGLLEQFAE